MGKYSAANYWIINTPTGGTCWLWGAYASVQGDTSTPPEMAAAPPPVAAEPSGGDSGNSSEADSDEAEEIPTLTGSLIINPGVFQLLLKPAMPASLNATAN